MDPGDRAPDAPVDVRDRPAPGTASLPAAVVDRRRLAAVHATGLLDTGPDEPFDRLARLAATVLSARSAFVTIVDDRRSFWKSCVGEDAAAGVRAKPVEESFCQYVVADGEPLIVGDAAADPRTRDNPSVSSMGVAAWAGCPVWSPDGHVLGTLCVFDTTAREWSDHDRDVLETLAHAASGEVALRVAVAERDRAAERQAYLLGLADTLRPLTDPTAIQEVASRALGERLGAARVVQGGALEALDADLRRRLRADETVVVNDAGATPWLADAERATHPDAGTGAYVAVPLVRGDRLETVLVVHHTAPRAWAAEEVALVAETADRTWAALERAHTDAALRASEGLLRLLFTSMEEAVVVGELIHDADRTPVDFRFLEVNAGFQEMFDHPAPVGRSARELLPDVGSRWLDAYAGAVREGRPRRIEIHSARLDKWIDLSAVPLRPYGRFAGVARDVTARKLAEVRARLRTAVDDALRPITDPDEVQARGAALLAEHLGDVGLHVAEMEFDRAHCTIAHSHRRDGPDLRGRHRLDDFGGVVAGELRAGRAVSVADTVADDRLADPERAAYAVSGARAILAAPLAEDGQLVAFALAVDTAPRAWTAEDVSVAVEVMARTWAAVTSARADATAVRVQAEDHRIALELQRALLPSGLLRHPEVPIAARYEAGSDVAIVGGDWYDSFTMPDGRVAVSVGDVVGHGLDAAATMGRFRVALAAMARHSSGPGQLLSRLDAFAAAAAAGPGFATACVAIYDPGSRELRHAAAGHPPILVVAPDGTARLLDGGRSAPLTGDVDDDRPEATEIVEPGALLVLYSDGLIERRREAITVGLDRLATAAAAARELPVEAVCDRLLTDLDVARDRDDDVVVLCLRTPGGDR